MNVQQQVENSTIANVSTEHIVVIMELKAVQSQALVMRSRKILQRQRDKFSQLV